MTIQEIQQFIPSKHIMLLAFIACVVTWKLTPFLRAMKSACSEKKADGTRGEVSLKRIIPMIFTLLICYMVISTSKGKATFNETAFWGLIGFISLATSIITVTQATGIMDKIAALKSGVMKQEAAPEQKPAITTTTTTEVKA